jgi:hypothetical protein
MASPAVLLFVFVFCIPASGFCLYRIVSTSSLSISMT